MNGRKQIRTALISVYHKEGLAPIVDELKRLGVTLYSTGGTQTALEAMGVEVVAVESLTQYPSILGGRVKTLHPKVFGGILSRRDHEGDVAEVNQYDIPDIDLVVVDLYPFEDTVASGASEQAIIEKIDIGGISLIRAAAKNYADVVIVPDRSYYDRLLSILRNDDGYTTRDDRKALAAEAFCLSSHYDTQIFRHFDQGARPVLKESVIHSQPLRYGENPHQSGAFFGDFDAMFEKLHGKELSYNNLLDVDAAVQLMDEFTNDPPTFAILKHNNACGCATRETLSEAYQAALASDPVSAFGGILIANTAIDSATALLVNDLFCEVVIAPGYSPEAVKALSSKKNRILLVRKAMQLPSKTVRSALNGFLVQDRDQHTETASDLKPVTKKRASDREVEDLIFANKLVKHTKSNTIVFAKNGQLISSGTGQTSRVDALKQAATKAASFGFSLAGAVMASDAFFPFPDCVELARNEGVTAVVQPGGSVKDQLSIDYCESNGMAMYFTGYRHFKH
jgi:phosphoribosylaminoimidazolecarboxamide formyltransferase/IMP cyclohydrolase